MKTAAALVIISYVFLGMAIFTMHKSQTAKNKFPDVIATQPKKIIL
jgi:hypothetical protein